MWVVCPICFLIGGPYSYFGDRSVLMAKNVSQVLLLCRGTVLSLLSQALLAASTDEGTVAHGAWGVVSRWRQWSLERLLELSDE